jgi:hypothetical protein
MVGEEEEEQEEEEGGGWGRFFWVSRACTSEAYLEVERSDALHSVPEDAEIEELNVGVDERVHEVAVVVHHQIEH